MTMGFFLLPNESSLVESLKLALTKPNHPRRRRRERAYGKRTGAVTRKVADSLTRELNLQYEQSTTSFANVYNAQPRWSLRDLHVKSSEQSEQCLQEFLRLVEHTANEFFWPGKFGTKGVEWRRHGWKHISYSVFCRCVSDEKTSLPPAMQADLLGTSERFVDLVRDAVNLKPRAIARLEYCFPKREDLIEALEFATNDIKLIAAARRMPAGAELAATWTSEVIRDPNSARAELVREGLQQLLSKGSALTSSSMGGRPQSHVHPDSMLSVYRMSYCLVRQIHEVQRFIDEHGESSATPLFLLLRYYPWLQKATGNDLLSFLNRSPSDAAVQMSAHILQISPSTVSQTIYRRRA
jgi:hypothetical protein